VVVELVRMPTLAKPPIFRYFLRKDEQRRRMTRRKEKMMEPEKKVKKTNQANL
jgi:hypothetical protein